MTTDPQAAVGGRQRQTSAGVLLEIWAVLLVLVPSAFVVAPLGAAGPPAQLVGLLAGAFWVASRTIRSRAVLTPGEPLRLAMGAFVLSQIASYLAAASRPIEGPEMAQADRGLLLVLSWWGITLLTSDGLVSRANLDRVLRLLVGLTAVAALVGILQYATGATIVDKIEIPGLTANSDLVGSLDRNGFARVFGTSKHPLEFGTLLTIMLPIGLHYGTVDTWRPRWRRYLPVALICAALPLTMSRTVVLGVAVVIVVLFGGWSRGQRIFALAALVVGLGVVYVTIPGFLGTMIHLFTGISEDSSALSRTDSLSFVFQYVAHNPLFGRGLSTFTSDYRIIDNHYLQMLVGAGFVGLAALVALFVTAFARAWLLSRRATSPESRSLGRAFAASVATVAIACLTFDALGFSQVASTLFLVVGAIGALERFGTAPATTVAASLPPRELAATAPAVPVAPTMRGDAR